MGGKTLYFGEIGNSSKTVTSYFERNGARSCGQDENPAEWMLEVTGTAGGSESTQDWSAIWNNSEERKAVKTELARMKENFSQQPVLVNDPGDPDALRSFAAPFGTQFWIVLKRVFQQYWRTPSYLYSKVALCLFCVSLIRSKNGRVNMLRDVSNTSLGIIYRFLVLENAQFASGAPKPDVRHLHVVGDIHQCLLTNHASLRNPTHPL